MKCRDTHSQSVINITKRRRRSCTSKTEKFTVLSYS